MSMSLYHYFNVNDNVIIINGSLSGIGAFILAGLAKTETVFYANSAIGILSWTFFAPIRAQISRCVPSEDLGKVNIYNNKVLIKHFFKSRCLPCWQVWRVLFP